MGPESDIEKGTPPFKFPSFEDDEPGEIKRVQEHFQIKTANFVEKFIERARRGKLERLTDKIWDTVENTDSHSDNVLRGDWETVGQLAEAKTPPRDWRSQKRDMELGVALDAPIIARRGDILHLVAGDTRLVVARALGKKPDVLIVDITDFE